MYIIYIMKKHVQYLLSINVYVYYVLLIIAKNVRYRKKS